MADLVARALAIKALEKKGENPQNKTEENPSTEALGFLQNFRVYMGNFFQYSTFDADKFLEGRSASLHALDKLDELIGGMYPEEEQIALNQEPFHDQETPLPDGSYPSYAYPQEIIDKGKENSRLLQARIDECAANGGGIVKLDTGEYPLYPGVDVNNCTLDLNGSIIYTVSRQHVGPLLTMSGENPAIINGEISGSYDTPYEVDSTLFEKESLIAPKEYQYHYGLIQNLDLHNCWGYALSGSGGVDNWILTTYIDAAVYDGKDERGYHQHIVTFDSLDKKWTGSVREFASAFKDRKYVVCTGGYGYVRIISDAKIRYRFYDKDGELIHTTEELPLIPVKKPDNATKFDVTVYGKYSKYPNVNSEFQHFRLCLCDYPPMMLTVRGCTIHNNSSLGSAGGSGYLMFYDIDSYENYKLRHSAEDNPRGKYGTTGFLDIEDIATPFLYMENCHSHDEKCLAMDGAYISQFVNCSGSTQAYRGWTMDVKNHVGRVGALTENVIKEVNIVNADMRNAVGLNANKINPRMTTTKDITSGIFDYMPYYDDFKCYANYSNTTYRWDQDDMAPNGSLFVNGAETDGFRLQLKVADVNPYTGKKSNFVYRQTLAEGVGTNGGTFMTVVGDCYNIDSNVMFCPNGYNFTNCKFELRDDAAIYASNSESAVNKSSGTYTDCVFDCYVVPYRFRNTIIVTNQINLTFNNCIIDLHNVTLFKAKRFDVEPNIVFNNCVINGKQSSEYTAAELSKLIKGVY